jgi:Tol biopolymer transport system component
LAFDLEALSGVSTPTGAVAAPSAVPKRARWIGPALIAAAIALAAGLAAGYRYGKKAGFVPPPSFQQLTFRRGEVYSARFVPDGQTVIYAAAWDGRPVELFATRTDRPESRVFGLVGADLLGISKTGEMAVSLDRHYETAFIRRGTLAEIGVSGGVAPREIQKDVEWADWAPNGREMAVVREVGLSDQLEYPIGKVLYQTAGWISHPRISPNGDLVAFMDHPQRGDDGGFVAVIDRAGKKKTLTERYTSEWGVAWSPKGDEVWLTAAKVGANRALYGVSLTGNERMLARVTQSLTLQDVSPDGRALVAHDSIRIGIMAGGEGQARERELAWLDWSSLFDLSKDGKTILFSETGEGSGPTYSTFLRTTDGSAPVRIGEGGGQALSPDGRWAAAQVARNGKVVLMLYPTGAGEAVELKTGALEIQGNGNFTPDGKRYTFSANEPGRGPRVYVMDIPDGSPKAITPEGYRTFRSAVSPDGSRMIVMGPDRKRYFYPLAGGEPIPIPGLAEDESPQGWSEDGRSLFVYRRRDVPGRVFRLDVTTGKKEFVREVMPADGSGIVDISPILLTPDARSYVYGFQRTLSDLYVLDGVK